MLKNNMMQQQQMPRPKMSMGFPTMQPMVAPTGVMQTATAAPAPAPAPAPVAEPMQPMQGHPDHAHGHDDMMNGAEHGQHIPGRFDRVPGMSDLISQYFSGGGDMRGLHEQARAYGQSMPDGRQGMGGILKNDGPGFLDYLRAHLSGLTPPTAVAAPVAAAPVIPPVVGG